MKEEGKTTDLKMTEREVVIEARGISKRYRIGVAEKKHDTLAGQLVYLLLSPTRNLKRLIKLRKFNNSEEKDVNWALKDINFEVRKGEVLGIIGHNGAGKSTLLKVLSRITEPTEGEIKIKGRVSSLLEVGTGFHPELSGRENIYMNGTILGMTRKEIDTKFDEIVTFSGIGKYLDTPVKFYSSGMKVRLAFSVAAHLEPEILIIDEVLAVGDAEFQKKCLGKMNEVADSGRTVLFVSHNMTAIQNLCHRGLNLEKGQIEIIGNVDEVIDKYIQHFKANIMVSFDSNGFTLENFKVSYEGDAFVSGKNLTISGKVLGECKDEIPYLILNFYSESGEKAFLLSSRLSKVSIGVFKSALNFSINIEHLNLMPNNYKIGLKLLSLNGAKIADWNIVDELEVFSNSNLAGLSLPSPNNRGIIYCNTNWNISYN